MSEQDRDSSFGAVILMLMIQLMLQRAMMTAVIPVHTSCQSMRKLNPRRINEETASKVSLLCDTYKCSSCWHHSKVGALWKMSRIHRQQSKIL
ncbi:hypothetical protein AOXY_G497 [Acipenser oxyrinchus oxyrinchus]|uniref:Uncharacterized protein n=1 Tax=Acipenser oxyrinchus oxyrinchus TaxID=40147 RepID=A0AAD8GKG8_ACIOX|nr:hypothetical protein AOXY_G497 [Acipenser oxyrinchus oxyrinchus]